MQPEAKKLLYDIQQAAGLLTTFTAGKSFADYEADPLLRSGVERQFEIVGEALSQLVQLDREVASAITEYRRIISFRNILIHGYALVDNRLVWSIVETRLPSLRSEVTALLAD